MSFFSFCLPLTRAVPGLTPYAVLGLASDALQASLGITSGEILLAAFSGIYQEGRVDYKMESAQAEVHRPVIQWKLAH